MFGEIARYYLRDVRDKVVDGPSAFKNALLKVFQEPIIPVEYLPITAKEKS